MPEESAVAMMEMRFDTGQLRCVKGFTSWENPSTKFTAEREELKMMKSRGI
jgi:hypothetical protein